LLGGEVTAKPASGSGAARDLRVLLAEGGALALRLLASEPSLAPQKVRGLAVDGDVADPHVRSFVHAGRHAGAPRTDSHCNPELDEDVDPVV
jgi:hypothetical protein